MAKSHALKRNYHAALGSIRTSTRADCTRERTTSLPTAHLNNTARFIHRGRYPRWETDTKLQSGWRGGCPRSRFWDLGFTLRVMLGSRTKVRQDMWYPDLLFCSGAEVRFFPLLCGMAKSHALKRNYHAALGSIRTSTRADCTRERTTSLPTAH